MNCKMRLMKLCNICVAGEPTQTSSCWLPKNIATHGRVVLLKPDNTLMHVITKIPEIPPYLGSEKDNRDKCNGIPLYWYAKAVSRAESQGFGLPPKPRKPRPKMSVLRDLVPYAQRTKVIDGYQKLREKSGLAFQAMVTGEELCELFINMSRKIRGRDMTNAAIAEEVADVLIVMDKMCHYFGISKSDVETAVTEKITKFLGVSCKTPAP